MRRNSTSWNVSHASRSKRASSQRRSANACAAPWPVSPNPNGSLQASSSSSSERPAGSRAELRTWVAPVLRPWTGTPSSHSVASPPVSSSRCQPSGTVARARSQYVANSGPSGSPIDAERHSPGPAPRITGPESSSDSNGARSA